MRLIASPLLAAGESGRPPWTFGIHDVSAIAWLCVAGYVAAAIWCLKASAIRAPKQAPGVKAFWLGLTLGLLALGINKPLDFHSLVIEIGRDLSLAEGWYAQRRVVLGVFILGVGAFGAGVVVVAYRRLHPLSLEMRLALGAFTALVGILLLRGSPFPIIGKLLRWSLLSKNDGLLHVHFSEVLELITLALVVVAARRYVRRRFAI